jgi:hypothetical protein
MTAVGDRLFRLIALTPWVNLTVALIGSIVKGVH